MTERPRHDWFQSDSDVVLTILKRNVPLDDCHVEISKENKITVKQSDEILFEGTLFSDVKNNDFTVQCTTAKIKIRLPKLIRHQRWNTLLSDGQGGAPTAPISIPIPASSTPSTTATTKKNWDVIEKEAVKAEEDEKEGDATVNKMFQKIYADASDDVRRATMKSYSESNGTVLSTNWNEISKKHGDVTEKEKIKAKSGEKIRHSLKSMWEKTKNMVFKKNDVTEKKPAIEVIRMHNDDEAIIADNADAPDEIELILIEVRRRLEAQLPHLLHREGLANIQNPGRRGRGNVRNRPEQLVNDRNPGGRIGRRGRALQNAGNRQDQLVNVRNNGGRDDRRGRALQIGPMNHLGRDENGQNALIEEGAEAHVHGYIHDRQQVDEVQIGARAPNHSPVDN